MSVARIMNTEIAETTLRLAQEARAINALFLRAMRESMPAFETAGCVGLSKETTRTIASLSDESMAELAQISVPLVLLVQPEPDANREILHVSGPVAARWGLVAASVAAFARNGIHHRGNTMRLVLGSRCACEWEMSEKDLSQVLNNDDAGVTGLRSRYRDVEWEALLRGAREGGEAARAARTYATQVITGSRGCPGCRAGIRRR